MSLSTIKRFLGACFVALFVTNVMLYSAAPGVKRDAVLTDHRHDFSYDRCMGPYFNRFEMVSERACELGLSGDARAEIIFREWYLPKATTPKG